ncbi:MAG: LysM peptidoglycan-binding domain-containing protein [Bacteroidales bacterium]|nr:LysM peptidoglycan-binding domain-containing protein [Bacteroidales bacterium]
MKRIKTLILLLNYLVLTSHCYSQSIDTIRNFQLYATSNTEMLMLLEEVTNTADNCPYFFALDKKYYVSLGLDTNHCSASILPQNVTSIYFAQNDPSLKKMGVCIYNNHVIHIQDYSDNNSINAYFWDKDSMVNLYFETNENYFDHAIPYNRYLYFSYDIKNGKFERNNQDDDMCEINERVEFDYMVKEDDTWASIAKKCGCSEQNLREEYPEFENPVKGMLLFVIYRFDENGNFIGVKRPYY